MYEGEFEELNDAGPKVFEFSGYCYVASFSAVVWAILYVVQTPGFTSEGIIEIGFRIVAAILLPGFLAFGGWLLFGRTDWATNIIWFIGFMLIGGHAFFTITKKGRALTEAATLAALPAPLSGQEVMAQAIAGRSAASLSAWRKPPLFGEGGSDPQRMASLEAATRGHLSKMLTSGKQFAAAFQILGQGTSVAARRYGSKGQLERQIFTTQLQLGLIKSFPKAVGNATTEYQNGIAVLDLSSAEREAVMAGYREGAERVGPQLLEYHRRVTRHGETTLEGLLLLSDKYGAWQRDLNLREIVFESKDAQAKYDEIMEELEREEPELRALRKQLGK